MLTCDDARPLLSGLVTGEDADAGVREHVASCDACRDELARLETEVERLRTDLTLLAPSPFLEDAVLEAARGAYGTRRRRWPVVALAAATALVLLFLALPRERAGDEGDDGKGADDAAEGPTVHLPPSAATVLAARNRDSDRLPAAGELTAAPKGTLHRFVDGGEDHAPGDVAFRATNAPRDGVMLLGNGLLARIGGEAQVGAGIDIVRGGKRWRSTPGSLEGEIGVASPEPGGAEAHIRVLVSTGYDGTLLLEEPLARALGLHCFEIPGRMRMEGATTLTGQRALARVRLPELGFDEVVEVQVRPPDLGTPRDLKRPYSVRIGGSGAVGGAPSEVMVAREIAWIGAEKTELSGDTQVQRNPDGVDEVRLDGAGAWNLLLSFDAWSKAQTRVIPGPLDVGPPTYLDQHAMRLGTLDLATRLTPGTPLTLARVWRGHEAIPSATAVVQTHVLEGGRVLAPTLWGEQGATIRGLARGPDGGHAFVDLVVDYSALVKPWLWINVMADGKVKFKAAEYPTLVDGQLYAAAFAAIRDNLGEILDRPGYRNEDGTARLESVLYVAPGTPWRVLQALLQVGANQGIRDCRFQRADAAWASLGAPVPYRLPTDAGIDAPPPSPRRTLDVVLTRRPGRRVEVRLRLRDGDGELVTPTQATQSFSVEDARTILGRGQLAYDRATIKAPPPFGRDVDAHGVILLIEALQALDIEELLLEGTPVPLPR